ncbi:MAG TPA: 5-oxoprolinase subunit PxpB [Thermoanaerobaculia bacterium]
MRVRDVADGAARVDFPEASEETGNRRAVAIAAALAAAPPGGFLAGVPGAATLLLLFDPLRLTAEALRRRLKELAQTAAGEPTERILRIPVWYGGPDLADLARERSMPEAKFAEQHAAGSYRVAFLGFAPGFAYLTGLPRQLHAPRLPTPRTRVPAGSVAIGGPYTGIYPDETPGGWRLIGRSPVRLFDPRATRPSLLRPGDEVRFEPIGEPEFHAQSARARAADSVADPPSGRPIIRVLSPGLASSVQGAPNFRFVSWGVPPGGAMDIVALAEGNARLGNAKQAAGLEVTLVGPELEALEAIDACLSGARPAADLDGRVISSSEPFEWRAGRKLRVARVEGGARSYICIAGGLAASGLPETSRRLKPGDLLYAPEETARGSARPFASPERGVDESESIVRVVLAEPGLFTPESVRDFLGNAFRVSASSDRRGVRLEGPPLSHETGADVPPEGTAPGAIQVPRDGQPIILGPDRPVTGGYAKVATVIGADLPVVAQSAPGRVLRFTAVSLSEALDARVRMERP